MRGTSPRYFGGARRDSGATAIEYAALVGVSAALVVVLVLVVSNPLATGMKRALCDLFNLGCTSEEFEYKPPGSLCIAGIDTRSVGGSVTILSIGVGQNFQLVKTKFGDGTIRVRIVPVDYSLSAEAELGGGVKFGKKTYGGEAGASIEGSLGFKYGDMWEFDSEEEANKWLDDMKWDLARKEGEKVSPGLWVFNKITGWEPRTRDPDLTEWEIGANGAVLGTAGFGKLTADTDGKKKVTDIGTGIDIEGRAGDALQVRKDYRGSAEEGYPLTSYTFEVSGSYGYGAKALGYGPGGKRSYAGQTRMTFDKDGRLKSMLWITTQETNATAGYKNPGKKYAGGKDVDNLMSATMTSIEFDDSNRAIGERWIRDNGYLMPFQTVRNALDENGSVVSRQPGPNADPLDRLLYERGLVTRNVYTGDGDEFTVGAEIAEGLKFGIEGGYESENLQIAESTYLGPPENGERSFVNWPECAAAGG